jgi:hypothetical protein
LGWLILVIRERRELRIFRMLLKLIPTLEERLMESSEEELMAIASMVRTLLTPHRVPLDPGFSCRKEPLARERMTPRASKAQS